MVVKRLNEKIHQVRSLSFVKKRNWSRSFGKRCDFLAEKWPKEDVRTIGICGAAGIGKTMVAGVACDCILDEFECFFFLDKIGEANLLGLQKRFFQILINVEGWNMYNDTNTNINEIKSSLCRKKTLLALDGVTKKEQIDNFAAGEWTSFHPGSRILTTTRDQKLLKVLNVDDKYIVNGLSPNEALQLFCHHAFKSDSKQGYEELCKSLIHYAGGHPLALEKFGSYLSAKSKDQWHKILVKLVRSRYLDCIDGVYSFLSFP